MESRKTLMHSVKKIYALFYFELKLQRKKFSAVLLLISLIVVFLNIFIYMINPGVPSSQESFVSGNLSLMLYMISLISGLLFSGIICDEYKKKTGLTLIPLISKGKILIAKFLANIILMFALITFYYLLIIYFDFYFYAEWIIPTILRSYGLALIISLAAASMVCLFSSFLPSSASVLLFGIFLMIFGFDIISLIISSINYQIEPVFSLTYLFNIVSISVYYNYTNQPRFSDISNEGSIIRVWVYPEVHMVVIVVIVYVFASLLVTYYIFKKKQL